MRRIILCLALIAIPGCGASLGDAWSVAKPLSCGAARIAASFLCGTAEPSQSSGDEEEEP